MKIRYISDIHTEFMSSTQTDRFLNTIPPGPDEVAVLAGDIGAHRKPSYSRVLEFFNTHFKRTYIIVGNHEFYGYLDQTHEELINEYRERIGYYSNIVFLENSFDVFEGIVFVGTTLWSRLTDVNYLCNDQYHIRGYSIQSNNARHETAVQFLDHILDGRDHQSVVVITHHLPSYKLIDEKYLGSSDAAYNQNYASDLDTLIAKHRSVIAVWIYGHTHTPSVQKIEGVTCICNPIGYPNQNPVLHVGATYDI